MDRQLEQIGKRYGLIPLEPGEMTASTTDIMRADIRTLWSLLADSLGAAWDEAEVALPEGYALSLVGPYSGGGYVARAHRYGWDELDSIEDAQGPTPAAALRALATKLAPK